MTAQRHLNRLFWSLITEGDFLMKTPCHGNIFRILVVCHYSNFIMRLMASQITNLTIVYSTVYSGTDQRKHQSPASMAFVRGIHRWPVNSTHKRPVTRKMFPFDDIWIWISRRGSETQVIEAYISMANAMPTHCSYCSLALNNRYLRQWTGWVNVIWID